MLKTDRVPRWLADVIWSRDQYEITLSEPDNATESVPNDDVRTQSHPEPSQRVSGQPRDSEQLEMRLP